MIFFYRSGGRLDMDFIFKFLLLAALVSPAPSQAGCVRDTLVALTRKLSAQPNSQAAFQKYFQGSDPAGWKKTIDEEVATTGRGVSLGGNSGGVNVVTLVGGSTVVTKSFPSDPWSIRQKSSNRWNGGETKAGDLKSSAFPSCLVTVEPSAVFLW